MNQYPQYPPPDGTNYGTPPPYYGQQVPVYIPPPKKQSLLWLWITLSVVGGIIVLSCITCAVGPVVGLAIFGNTISKQVQTATVSSGPSLAVRVYYDDLELQNYSLAYTYTYASNFTIQGQQVDRTNFIQQYTDADATKGKIRSFSLSATSFDTGGATATPDATDTATATNSATITATITRSGQPYAVKVKLSYIYSSWQISSIDNT